MSKRPNAGDARMLDDHSRYLTARRSLHEKDWSLFPAGFVLDSVTSERMPWDDRFSKEEGNGRT